jgi:hypothetical protein
MTAASGTINLDLAGVLNGVIVNAGHGTNVIISGSGNDTINLLSGSGTDSIQFNTTGGALDTITNFQAGTATDILLIGVSAMSAGGVTLVKG